MPPGECSLQSVWGLTWGVRLGANFAAGRPSFRHGPYEGGFVLLKKVLALLVGGALVPVAASVVVAAPLVKPNPQQFEIYDSAQDGIDPGDPDIGNVRAVANPGGQER